MGQWLIKVFGSQSGAFPSMLALAYLTFKLYAKWHGRRVLKQTYDGTETATWFGVDLAMLAISISVTASVPVAYRFSTQGATWWYIVHVVCLFLSIFGYQLFLFYRVQPARSRWGKTVRVRTLVCVNLFLGFAPFLATTSVLAEGSLQ
jgi:hypothetical protein